MTREWLLVAADLDERPLLLAELLEAGYEVTPIPGLSYALHALPIEVRAAGADLARRPE
jgi:hypothetical protein